MTYLAFVHGARGIQYFIRLPRLSRPKSPAMWSECGGLALETAELTPALTSAEIAPKVTSSVPAVHVSSDLDRGLLTILAVNTENKPHLPNYQIEGSDFTGQAHLIFEDRHVAVEAGAIHEPIAATSGLRPGTTGPWIARY